MTSASRILRVAATLCLAASAACGDDGAAAEGETGDTAGSSSGATNASVDDGTTAPASTSSATTDATLDGASSSAADSGSGSDSSSGSGTTGEPGELDPRVADCLRIDACEADGGTPIGVQACLAHALDLPWEWASTGVQRMGLEALSCKLAASDCETVRACTPAIEGYADLCAENAGMDVCDGDTWVFCDFDGAPILAMDCAAAGESCNRDIWAGCGTDSCQFGMTEPECDGDVLVQCDPAGWVQEIDCATQYNFVNVNGPKGEEVFSIAGETCGFDEMMSALGCIGTGEACGFFEQSCEGDVLETCAGGALSQRDCATLEPTGQSCGFWPEGPFAGAATCGYVDPPCALDADEACHSGRIAYCEWDHAAEVDCVAEGYSGCETAASGGRTIAWCTP